jgi:hypothetical protein
VPDAWAVITPDGDLAWYPLGAGIEVEALVGANYAPGALARAYVTGPIRVLASDVALLAPEHYPSNPVARVVITALSETRISQPWRGHVALVQYDQDEVTGEWLWPMEMDELWRERITKAVALARGGWGD